MPRHRKPLHLKQLAGTVRRHRPEPPGAVVPVDLDADPLPPDWLPGPEALAEWHRLVPLLRAQRLLAESDLTTLAHLCALHGRCVRQYAAGITPKPGLLSVLRLMRGSFGLTPVTRIAGRMVSSSNAFAALRLDS